MIFVVFTVCQFPKKEDLQQYIIDLKKNPFHKAAFNVSYNKGIKVK